ncbi:MAG: trypsin-like peptidase domain-containing protein [Spirochaetota bacterium]
MDHRPLHSAMVLAAALSIIVANLFLGTIHLPAQSNGGRVDSIPGKPAAGTVSPEAPVQTTLYLRKDGENLVRYRFFVPEDAFAVRFRLTDVSQDLDLIMRSPDGSLLHYSEAPDYNETLFVSRLSNPPLQPGEYILEVAYQLAGLPRRGGRTVTEVPFRLSMITVETEASARLQPETKHRTSLLPDEGMARFFEVEVPPDAKALRIDISDTDGDLDLFVSKGKSGSLPLEADHVSQSLLSREHLVITPASTPPLERGVYTITVLDQIGGEYETPFSITVGLSPEPPSELRELPHFSEGATPRPTEAPADGDTDAGRTPLFPPSRAVDATVEITTGEGSLGSGVIISPEGHILTNWHVVRDPGGGADKVIYVGVTEDPARPPTEAFRARVIDYREDRDLALLKIVSDLYGGQLPGDYTFPWLPLGNDGELRPTEEIGLIGFPRVGGTGSRASVTYTKGIVSGFEAHPYGRVIKTDADANQGNSGGAAVDRTGALIGIPSHVVGLEWGHVGFVQPVSAIPQEWVRQVEAAIR